MKKISFLMTVALAALLFTSCNKADYTSFIGTWGVEKIEYYNIDYAGNPIAASMESYTYNPDDPDNTIQLVFRGDRTGEMRDGAIDTLWLDYNVETGIYETVIYAPDTILVSTFTYVYDESESSLIMRIKYTYPYEKMDVFMVKVSDLTDNSFSYENEYDIDFMEKAYLRRVNSASLKEKGRVATKHPHKPGSLLGNS